MPELRKDPITGRWVIIAVERARRPRGGRPSHAGVQEKDCPFCEGKEAMTPPEIFAIRKEGTSPNTAGWQTRVVASKTPFLRVEGNADRHGRGLYDVMGGVGAHEVIVETPQHIANLADLDETQIAKGITCWIDRFVDLSQDPRFKYVLVFQNYGWGTAGRSIRHARSQLIATPITPKRVKEELHGARKYYEYHERCVFCDLIRQETKSKERIVAESDSFIAVTAYASRSPFETWILPKEHNCDFSRMNVQSRLHLGRMLKQVLGKIKKGLDDTPYNFILHTAPFRRKTSKAGYWRSIEDDYHWHLEIMPNLTNTAGFEWGTGFYICPIAPEEAAQYLREIEI